MGTHRIAWRADWHKLYGDACGVSVYHLEKNEAFFTQEKVKETYQRSVRKKSSAARLHIEPH